jgi:arginine deiminase
MVAAMPKFRAAMHLDTIFTYADRDLRAALFRHRQPHPCLLVLPE